MSEKRRRRGEGSVVQVGPGRWRVFVDLGPDPLTGRRRRISRTVRAETEEQALRELERLKVKAEQRAVATAPANLTVSEWLEEWLAMGKTMGWSPMTYESYAKTARKVIAPFLGQIKLRQLERRHVQRWITALVEAGYRPSSIATRRSILHAALQAAVDQGLLPTNPADRVRIPQAQGASRPKVVPDDELRAFLEAARPSPWYLPIRLLIATGMRRSEVLGLRWQDVDWEAGAVHVRQTVILEYDEVARKKRPLIRPAAKTAAGVRTIYLGDRELLALLRRHRQQQRIRRLQAGPAWQDHDLVFCRDDGTPLAPYQLTEAVRNIARRAGLKGRIWPHALRHTHASTLLALGWPLTEVSHRLGHASPVVTAKLYSHALPDLQARLVRELGTSLAREAGAGDGYQQQT